jgi:hypothetical protein
MIGKIEGWWRADRGRCDGESQRDVTRGSIEMCIPFRSKMSMIHLLLNSRKISA